MTKEERREYNKRYYQKHKEERKEYNKQYRQEHKEYYKEYYQDNKEEKKEYRRQYYLKNREKELEQQKQYNQNNRDDIREYQKKYRQDNRDDIRGYQKKYRQTPMGRANNLLSTYNCSDNEAGRGKGDLTAQWIVDNIFSKSCHYCDKTDWTKIGCDRINNALPHTMDNVVPCCEECNKKRGTKSYEEFKNEASDNTIYVSIQRI